MIQTHLQGATDLEIVIGKVEIVKGSTATFFRCNCGHCVSMPTAIECVCCCEIQEVEDKKNEVTPPVKCITNHPGFSNVCLDIWVLQTAYYLYCQHYGSHTHQGSLHE